MTPNQTNALLLVGFSRKTSSSTPAVGNIRQLPIKGMIRQAPWHCNGSKTTHKPWVLELTQRIGHLVTYVVLIFYFKL